MTDGGASVVMKDSRVSYAINWLLGLLGVALIGIGAWIATSINELTLAVARGTERIEFIASMQRVSDARNDVRNDNQDNRLGRVEQDVAAIRGVGHRGEARSNGR